METLKRWEKAQRGAASPEDWNAVDLLAIELASQGFADVEDVRSAVKLAILRLRGTIELPIDDGQPSVVWIEHLLHAVWNALGELSRIREIFLELPFSAHSIGRDNKIFAVSRSWCELLGFEPEEVLGKRSVDFLTPESKEMALTKILPRFWKEGAISRVEYMMVSKVGCEVPVLLSAAAEFDPRGRAVRSLAILSRR